MNLIKPTLIAGSLLSLIYASTLFAKDYSSLLSQIKVTSSTGQQESYSYEELIKKHQLTGLSLAVIDDHKVVYSTTAGFKSSNSNERIDQNTSFSTASISKAVTGVIAVMLSEAGKLDLDKPVKDYLKRWQLPNNEFTKAKQVTLRHLLSHTAGTTQWGFADFYQGDEVPSLIDSLNGKLPRYNQPVSVDFEPETAWRYSGGGYVVAQVAIEDVTGKSLQQLADEMLFKPLGMNNTTMYQHGHPSFLSNVAKVHDRRQKVIKSGIPICPQIAPSGMWSSANDMAVFIIEMQKALAGETTKVISSRVAKLSTEIQTVHAAGGWGLGWMRFEADGNLNWFSHGGSNTGTGGHIMGTMQDGRGIAIFGNGPNQVRMPVINQIKAHIVESLGWQQDIAASKQKVSESALNNLVGRYISNTEISYIFDTSDTIEISKNGDKLELTSGGQTAPLIHVGGNRFTFGRLPVQLSYEAGQGYVVFSRLDTSKTSRALKKLPDSVKLPFELVDKVKQSDLIAAFKDWQKNYPLSGVITPRALNNKGYHALATDNYTAAIDLFTVATELYPNNANAYDSLAEGYYKSGNSQLALLNYKKSLQLDPKNNNASEMISKLVEKN